MIVYDRRLPLPPGVELRCEPERTIVVPEKWSLRLPGGGEIPLIGNRNAAQRRDMIRAILTQRGLIEED